MYVGLWHDQADGVGSLTTAGWLPSSRQVSVYLRAGLALTRLCCLECDVDEPEAKPGCVLATCAAEMICDTSCTQYADSGDLGVTSANPAKCPLTCTDPGPCQEPFI